MASAIPSVAGVTAATVTLPSTPQPRKYLVVASFQLNHQAAATVRDYISEVRLAGVMQKRAQYTNIGGQYTFSIPVTCIVESSGGALTLVASRTTDSGGQVLDRSHYTVVDLGIVS